MHRRPWLIPCLSTLVFLLTSLVLLPYPGLQNDELFFSGPLYDAHAAFYQLEIGAAKIPLMVMSYTGALKTWLYAGLFEFVPPNEWSVRMPMLLLGAGTIWLTWVWVRRIAGLRAAAIATVLLATDTIFLMTNNFDWGPVALQHVLLMGGLVAIQAWLGGDSRWMLALAFFLWGLGMWDKALLSWPLIGLAVASACVFPREIARRVRPLTAGIALGAFLLGAAPLVWYNIDRPGETATTNAKFTTDGMAGKIAQVRQTIDGSTLFGYMVYGDSAPDKRAPRTRVERISAAVAGYAGNHRRNLMLPGYLLALACFVGLWGSPAFRILAFLLVAMIVEWVQMALTKGTGGASHHVILIWPFPLAFTGIAFSAMADRVPRFGGIAVVAVVGLLAAENLLTTNEYLREFTVNGASGGWTDAVHPLANSVESDTASWIGLFDWGYLNQLRMFHEGDLPLFIVDQKPMKPDMTDADRAQVRDIVGSADRLFIQHTADKQMFPGVNDLVRKAAEAVGFEERVERLVRDRNGRPVFELFRFQKADAK